MLLKRAVPLAAALVLQACAGSATFSNDPLRSPQVLPPRPSTPLGTTLRTGFAKGTTPIQHVIFIVQENRSFNNLFMGYPGAKTSSYGYDTHGDKIQLTPQDLSEGWDLGHTSQDFFKACDGIGNLPGTKCKMDGFDNEFMSFGSPANAPYSYVPKKQVDVYWKIAHQYVLADRMFASNLDASFVAHQYIVAAYASRSVDTPYGAWGCEGGSGDDIFTLTNKRTHGKSILACFDNPTIASEADTAGINWRFYTGSITGDGGLWSSYQADRQVYEGPDWSADVINPPSQFLTDIAGGKLASITWITPTNETSDHPGVNPDTGPAWVASLVNAIGTSKFWNSCAIFIMWDDWGGFFDPVKPPFKDYDGLGFRVPLLIVSPYAKQGYVSHVHYETSSVLRYIEDNFGLAIMAKSDARAHDPSTDAFDYSQQPRVFKKFRGAQSRPYWTERDRFAQPHSPSEDDLGD